MQGGIHLLPFQNEAIEVYIPMIAFMECLLVEDKIVKRVQFRNQFVFYGHSCVKQMYLGELEPIPSSTDQCGMFSKAA